MFLFLVPLVFGFASHLASAFTLAYSRWWGERRGSIVTAILRNVLGIPIWATGFVFAVRTPSPVLFATTSVTQAVAWLIVASGVVIIIVALATIRVRAAVPSTRDRLARNGIYAQMRHPIHTGTLFEFVGLFLLVPTQTVALACALGIGWVLVQTEFEEYDLLQRAPEYREYMSQVSRYLPRLRMK